MTSCPSGRSGPRQARQGHLFPAWSISDADLVFMLHRLVMNEDPVPEPIRAYAASQWKRPSIRAFVDHERPKS